MKKQSNNKVRNINVGRMCRELREKYGITVKDIIETYGGQYSQFYRFENGVTSSYYPFVIYLDMFQNELLNQIVEEMRD